MKQRTARAQRLEHLGTRAARGLRRLSASAMGLEKPRQILPEHECDRRAPGRRLARPGSGLLVRRIAPGACPLDQRKPAPHNLAREAEVIEPFGAVGMDPRAEGSLPFSGRPLRALKLLDHFGYPGSPVELSAGCEVPPGLEKLLPLL